MLTAIQAHELVKNSYMPVLLNILKEIRIEAEKGRSQLKLFTEQPPRVVEELRGLGYTVLHQRGVTEYDTDITHINW